MAQRISVCNAGDPGIASAISKDSQPGPGRFRMRLWRRPGRKRPESRTQAKPSAGTRRQATCQRDVMTKECEGRGTLAQKCHQHQQGKGKLRVLLYFRFSVHFSNTGNFDQETLLKSVHAQDRKYPLSISKNRKEGF